MNKDVILILAAGSSSRLGRPKQLIQYHKQTLLNYIITEAEESQIGEVLVLLGANADLIKPELKTKNYHINPNWTEGMGNSISFGVNTILKNNTFEGLYLLLADQYKVNRNILVELSKAKSASNKGILISKYDTSAGPPAYFQKKYFKALANLDGDNGAKDLIKQNLDDCAYFSFPEGTLDIDTLEDLNKLN